MFRVKGGFDIDEFYRGICKREGDMFEDFSVRMGGGRPELHGETPGAQLIINLRSVHFRGGTAPINAKVVVSHKGAIQIFYEKTEDLFNSLFFLKQVLGYEAFDRLLFVDGDFFNFLVSCVELRQIRFVQTSFAMDLNREPIHSYMYFALIDVLRTIFKEIEKIIDEAGDSGYFNSYKFVKSLISPIQGSLTELMVYLKEDPKFAKEMLTSLFRWLDSFEKKAKMLSDIELQESEKIGSREEWIEWQKTNKIWLRLNLQN